MAYCEGCIAACDLALKILNGKKAEAPKVEEPAETPAVEATPAVEEKPKRKRTTKKKEAPVVEETPEEDDLDDLL
ncbi:MAG: hypothetical protein E6726_16800 [Clostridium sp.]|uniref:hypothetical protein n=1 Tax=Clostridium sp. TaxID=1506 RepID=UPI002901C6D9|nr:hypothetical protein [Clostridium sp.]MDU1980055.1 hypothetical protein [Clostridium sp.]